MVAVDAKVRFELTGGPLSFPLLTLLTEVKGSLRKLRKKITLEIKSNIGAFKSKIIAFEQPPRQVFSVQA